MNTRKIVSNTSLGYSPSLPMSLPLVQSEDEMAGSGAMLKHMPTGRPAIVLEHQMDDSGLMVVMGTGDDILDECYHPDHDTKHTAGSYRIFFVPWGDADWLVETFGVDSGLNDG